MQLIMLGQDLGIYPVDWLNVTQKERVLDNTLSAAYK